MSRVVNSTLGTICTYHKHSNSEDYPDIPIIIDRNSAVNDAVGNLLGFEVTASVEKSFINNRPSNLDSFTDDEGNIFVVGQIREETRSKWYFVVTER